VVVVDIAHSRSGTSFGVQYHTWSKTRCHNRLDTGCPRSSYSSESVLCEEICLDTDNLGFENEKENWGKKMRRVLLLMIIILLLFVPATFASEIEFEEGLNSFFQNRDSAHY